MNKITVTFFLLITLIIIGFAGVQLHGYYSIKACAEITKRLGSDYRQCFSGKANGIVGITLKVNPIAYKIVRHKNQIHVLITRWHQTRAAQELLGIRGQDKFHLSVHDQEIASIAFEIEQYTHPVIKDSDKIQSYEKLTETTSSKRIQKEYIIKEYMD